MLAGSALSAQMRMGWSTFLALCSLAAAQCLVCCLGAIKVVPRPHCVGHSPASAGGGGVTAPIQRHGNFKSLVGSWKEYRYQYIYTVLYLNQSLTGLSLPVGMTETNVQEVKLLQMFCRDDWRDSCKDTHWTLGWFLFSRYSEAKPVWN